MSDRTCKTCKHWKKIGSFNELPFAIGECALSPFDEREMRADQMAISPCGHDGGIVAGENFGCVHWEAKQ